MQLTPALRTSYANSWAAMKVKPNLIPQLKAIADNFAANRARYDAVQQATETPWWWAAIAHKRESDCDFSTYLGNGDPLNRVTRDVPSGRGPFPTWQAGAIDALHYDGIDKWTDWSIEGALYKFEAWNGWGYRGKTNSPYLWAWTNQYESGKYIADGNYSASAIDHQPGCAAMLWQMIQMGLIPPFPDEPEIWTIARIQEALNKLGASPQLEVDGVIGNATVRAIRLFQIGHNLEADGICGIKTTAAIEAALTQTPT